MAIRAAKVISEPIYLADLYPLMKKLEDTDGECPQDQRAWVRVRQATERDNMEIATMSSQGTSLVQRASGEIERRQSVNVSNTRAFEVYLTLADAGNIENEDGKPMFSFKNDRAVGGFEKFVNSYGTLPIEVTWAMTLATYKVNPTWDWVNPVEPGE